MHFFFVIAIPELINLDVRSIFWRALMPLPIFALCALLSSILSRIPILKLFVGA